MSKSRLLLSVVLISVGGMQGLWADKLRTPPGHRKSIQTEWRCGRKVVATSERINEIWRRYAETPRQEDRDYLVETYLDLVRYHAERMIQRLPPSVDIADLMSEGVFGLMEAIDTFDLSRGVKFTTYSARRIRGAILDSLRSQDQTPRLVRIRKKMREKVILEFEQEHRRKPNDSELRAIFFQRARKRGATAKAAEEETYKILKDAAGTDLHNAKSLNRKVMASDQEKVPEWGNLLEGKEPGALEQTISADKMKVITQGLDRSEKLIIILYYVEGLTMKEIGQVLDLCESRVSQMHTSILQRLAVWLFVGEDGTIERRRPTASIPE